MTNKEKHKKVWMWLAEKAKTVHWQGPINSKAKAFEALKYPRVMNYCFACESTKPYPSSLINCSECPCDWGTPICTSADGSIYERWVGARTVKTRKKYALKIANCWR